MKIQAEIKSYCPKCRKHTLGKVSDYKPRQARKMAKGQKRHELKTKGYTSKIAGKVEKVKQSKKHKMMVTCKQCGKKHEKILPHSKKKPEIQKQ